MQNSLKKYFARCASCNILILIIFATCANVLAVQFSMEELEADADIIVLNSEAIFDITDKSNWIMTKKVKIKVLTYAGKKKNSELKFNYNPVWEKVEILSAKVIDSKGKEHILSKKETNLMDSPTRAPRYPTRKVLVASLPGVDVGSILNYSFKITNKNKPFLSTKSFFGYGNPIVNKKITLSIPNDLKYKIVKPKGENIKQTIKKDKNKIIYTLEVKNQNQNRDEDYRPEPWIFVPTFFLSTGNWESYANVIEKAFINATKKQTEIERITKEIVENKSKKNQIIAIRDYVSKNILRQGSYFFEQPLSYITPADTTLSDGYGNSADCAIVLYSMLKSAGFSPDFLLSSSYYDVQSELEPLYNIPQINLFYKTLVKVQLDGKYYILNDSSQYSKLGTSHYDNCFMMNLKSKKVEFIDIADDLENKSRDTYNIKILENGDAKIESIDGIYGTSFAKNNKYFSELTPEKRKRYFQELVSSIALSAKPASDLVTDFKQYPGITKFSVDVAHFAVRDDDYLYFELPNANFLSSLIPLRANKRSLPYKFDDFINWEITYNIELPKAFKKIKLRPKDLDWISPNGKNKILISTKTSDNEITIVYRAKFSPSIIKTENYDILLKMNKLLQHPNMKFILTTK